MDYNERFLPPSLRAYQQGKSPVAAMQSQAPMQRQAAPQRSRMLAQLMGQAPQQPDAFTTTAMALPALWGGYKQATADVPQQQGGIVQDPAEMEAQKAAMRQAGLGAMTSGVAGIAGAMIPGWGGKVAQIAAILAGQYAKDRAAQSRGSQLASILKEPDANKRANAALLLDQTTQTR